MDKDRIFIQKENLNQYLKIKLTTIGHKGKYITTVDTSKIPIYRKEDTIETHNNFLQFIHLQFNAK